MGKCPFCEENLQLSTDEEKIDRIKERIENCNDELSIHILATCYDVGGRWGVPQDSKKAHQLWIRAAELGLREAHHYLSRSYGKYHKERGVDEDDKKELYHLEEAAILGDAASRCDLGMYEGERGNWDKAKKHWMLSASAGCEGCFERIKRGKKKGVVTSNEYKKTLRAYKESLNLTRSAQRDAAREFFQHNFRHGPGGVGRIFE